MRDPERMACWIRDLLVRVVKAIEQSPGSPQAWLKEEIDDFCNSYAISRPEWEE